MLAVPGAICLAERCLFQGSFKLSQAGIQQTSRSDMKQSSEEHDGETENW